MEIWTAEAPYDISSNNGRTSDERIFFEIIKPHDVVVMHAGILTNQEHTVPMHRGHIVRVRIAVYIALV